MKKSEVSEIFRRVKQFVFRDVWDLEISSLPPLHAIPVRIYRVGHLVVKGFIDDELSIRASALTYTALLSLVPLLALVFSLLKGFGAGQEGVDRFMEWQTTMPQQFQDFISQTVALAQNTNFAALGWAGFGVLVLAAITVLGSIETSFNRIWGITISRNLIRRIANYISILVVVPILIGLSGTVIATLSSEKIILQLGSIGSFYRSFLKLSPLVSAWLAFSFLYVFLPNTRVKAWPAFWGSLIAALLWLGWQKAYISLQIGVARYNAIYGTFASIPIFLAWVYISWVIVLLGAEIAFAVQHHDTYHIERESEKASLRARATLGMALIAAAAVRLEKGDGCLVIKQFAAEQKIPVRLLYEVVKLFVEAGWLSPVADREDAYALLKTPDRILLKNVINIIMDAGVSAEYLGLDRLEGPVPSIMARYGRAMEAGLENKTVLDLLDGLV
ncbi:MAG: YihY/virulence factor BrkB family protein [Kiritimatiellia bacterium]